MNRFGRDPVARSRNQSGVTMVEILLAVAIGSMLTVPLGAWTYGTLQSGMLSRDELGRASATGLLNVYFLRDVASARSVTSAAEGAVDCTGVAAKDAGIPVLRAALSGDQPTSFVYVVVGGSPTTPAALVRHRCGPDGALVAANPIMGSVERDTVVARCYDTGGHTVACTAPEANRASITVRPWTRRGVRDPITVSGTRRTSGAGTGFAQSNPPDVSFTISPGPRGYDDTEFTLTSTSRDPDGDPLQLNWSLPAGSSYTGQLDATTLQVRLPDSGQIVLTASDGTGNTVAGSVFVEIVNRPPSITLDPTCTLLSGRTFRLASDAVDEDGDPLTATWTDSSGTSVTGIVADWTAPPTLSGEQVLQLSVTDGRGAAPVRYARCVVGSPPGPVVQFSPAPDAGGVINSIPPGGVLPVTFTAPAAGSASISWALYRKGEATPVNSSSGSATWTLDFVSGEHGEYEVVVVTDGTAGPRVPFRVNAQPVVTLAVTAQTGQVPARVVTFRSTATDPDGTISSTTWDFGDGTPVSHDPAGDVAHTYTAPGTYTIGFVVTDDRGGTATVTQTIVVEATP